MLGVYIHIPFCKRKCNYCDFCSIPNYDDKKLDNYCKALIAQFDDYFRKGGKYEVDTVYFGGGTPSILGGKRIKLLMKELKKRITLKYPEITVEVNPESCDKRIFKQLRSAGVNRISMGVQSANDEELAVLGRLHTFAQAQQAAQLCRKYCTENLSVDMMYGLPNQTTEGALDTLNKLIELKPTHISCYSLKLEPGTKMGEENPELPDDETQENMYFSIIDRLKSEGYAQYEISNFAKEGKFSRHNSKYWDLSDYLGFGCSAHSYYCGKRFSFTGNVDKYISGALGKTEIIEEMDEMASGDRHGEYIMLKLRTCSGISEQEFYSKFGIEFTEYGNKLDKYIATGHAVKSGGSYRLTPKGFMVSNPIIADVLDALL